MLCSVLIHNLSGLVEIWGVVPYKLGIIHDSFQL